MLSLFFALSVFATPPEALNFSVLNPVGFQRFLKRQGTFSAPDANEIRALEVGATYFVPVRWVRPGQARYSFTHVLRKFVKNARIRISRRDRLRGFRLGHDHGRSLLRADDPVDVVLLKHPETGEIFLHALDGNHGLLASLLAGAITIPVKVHESYVQRANEYQNLMEMHELLLQDGNSFPFDLRANFHPVEKYADLINDPNLSLVRALLGKVILKNGEIKKVSGPQFPVILKFRGDHFSNFEELLVATALHLDGVHFNEEIMDSEHLPEEFVEDIRQRLFRLKASGSALLKDITIIARRVHRNEITLDPNDVHNSKKTTKGGRRIPDLFHLWNDVRCLSAFNLGISER